MITEQYLRSRLGNDDEFFRKLFEKYFIFKVVDYDILPDDSKRLLEAFIREREKQIPERLKAYFKSEVGIGRYAEIENKSPIDLSAFDGRSFVIGMSILKVNGNKIAGILYD